jgi:hypothetical protein
MDCLTLPPLKSGNSVYVVNLEKSNLTESVLVETSIDVIRNSVIELTPNVLVSPKYDHFD